MMLDYFGGPYDGRAPVMISAAATPTEIRAFRMPLYRKHPTDSDHRILLGEYRTGIHPRIGHYVLRWHPHQDLSGASR